jgi:hypothetical protein
LAPNSPKLPSGQIIDIPYLKQLDACVVVLIAYCQKGNIDQVTNFVPGYLARTARRLWELYDKEDYILDTFIGMREKTLFWTDLGPQFSILKIILCNILVAPNLL